jgi:GDP-4-dehydro-6-deoxy-D-mannose reductase
MSHEPTVLVLAGSSFVGRYLSRRLRDGGFAVASTGQGERLGYCDISDRQSVRKLFGTVAPEYVLQCAAATSPNATGAEMYRVHVTGTLNVLRAAAEYTPSAVLVFLGSAAEYGVVEECHPPIHEDQPSKPVSLFGASKAAQTQWALAAAVEWRLRVLVARPFNLLGLGLPDHYLAAALAQRLLEEGASAAPLRVANADATRDFVDVRDAVEALVALVEQGAPEAGRPQLFNIAAGQETAVIDIARMLCELQGGSAAVPLGAAVSRSHIRRSCGDASRLREATGWRPQVTWQQSLSDMWDHLRAGGSCFVSVAREDKTYGTYRTHKSHPREIAL